jgi:hypothetical protein
MNFRMFHVFDTILIKRLILRGLSCQNSGTK